MDATKLRSYLECPVCLLLPRSNIFVCTNGHKICESCYNKLKGGERAKTCPQGGCTYDRPPRRARDAEAMIENSDFNLGCSRPGCLVEMKKGELDVHEISCVFRKVPCPDMSCDKKVQYKWLDLHFKEKHKDSTILSRPILNSLLNEHVMTRSNLNRACIIYQEAGFVFYPTLVIKDGLWYFWIKMKTDQVAAASWAYHAKCENVELELLVEFTGGVHPVDLGLKEIIESGQYMILNKQKVMKLKVRATDIDVKAGYPDKIDISFKLFKK